MQRVIGQTVKPPEFEDGQNRDIFARDLVAGNHRAIFAGVCLGNGHFSATAGTENPLWLNPPFTNVAGGAGPMPVLGARAGLVLTSQDL
jgi:hypothetical protein